MSPTSATAESVSATAGFREYVDREFYLAARPVLPWRANLSVRYREPGTPLRIVGVVRGSGVGPLSGAEIDLWQADRSGCYSGYSPEIPVGNLRGTVITCAGGRFDITTVVPGVCEFAEARGEAGYLNAIVRARGHRDLAARLVPVSGLPGIAGPIDRAALRATGGRAPLAVRAGSDGLECWCEFVLTGAGTPHP
ncbi:intradiol ring-cleavage dioxygenase [Rhodococcus sp. NPDC059234]|uniref:dioxygenase family protein n=1 Tax=Rhodococcus sp. NPDC059234 TaxID=3346781 RepID=UPI00367134D0